MNRILTIAVILLLMGIASAGGTSYVHANGQTIAKINESGIFYYHSDHIGSTSAMTDSEGKVIEEQINLPFGEQISGSEKYGFTGKEHDETGLQYFGARHYSPLTGRFLTVDSVKDGVNWYSYAAGNPLKFIDPNGREIKSKNKEWDNLYDRKDVQLLFGAKPRIIIRKALGFDPDDCEFDFIIEEVDPDSMSPIFTGEYYDADKKEFMKTRDAYYDLSKGKILVNKEASKFIGSPIEVLGAMIEQTGYQRLRESESKRDSLDYKYLKLIYGVERHTDVKSLIEAKFYENEVKPSKGISKLLYKIPGNKWLSRWSVYDQYKKIQNQKLAAQYRLIDDVCWWLRDDERLQKDMKKAFKREYKKSLKAVKNALGL